MSGGGDGAAQKARNRARGKEQQAVTGLKPLSGGSSGFTLFMSRIRKRRFEEVADQARFVCDVAATISDIRKTAAGSLIVTFTLPAAYQCEAIEAMDASSMGFVMFRCYVVPRHPFMPDEEAAEAGSDA